MPDEKQLPQPQDDGDSGAKQGEKPPFVEPRLTFMEPKLSKRGSVREVTAGFFGSFSV